MCVYLIHNGESCLKIDIIFFIHRHQEDFTMQSNMFWILHINSIHTVILSTSCTDCKLAYHSTQASQDMGYLFALLLRSRIWDQFTAQSMWLCGFVALCQLVHNVFQQEEVSFITMRKLSRYDG